MSTFKRSSKSSQEIPTAALPDIIFMLLFFFMVVTVLRTTDLLVRQQLPNASQLTKVARKSLVSYIYIGEPKNISVYGVEPKIQVNDVFVDLDDIVQFVNQEKDKLDEVERDKIIMSIRADIEVKMGIISDIQEELRRSNARKVLYSSSRRIDS